MFQVDFKENILYFFKIQIAIVTPLYCSKREKQKVNESLWPKRKKE